LRLSWFIFPGLKNLDSLPIVNILSNFKKVEKISFHPLSTACTANEKKIFSPPFIRQILDKTRCPQTRSPAYRLTHGTIPRHLFAFHGNREVMKIMSPSVKPVSDEQLWRRSREGDRDAFGQIVGRYQSLICSLAYSSSGNLAGSEDVAQETFITAWKRLADLREPSKLRAWLCGIARNLAAITARRELRRGGAPQPLEAAAEHPSPEIDPGARAVTEEEAGLLWRALAELPETYREPLVLFYREQQSVAQVAEKLELSEDTVKQRLSRGRALLREEMTALVESALTRSRPGLAFKMGVLAALPIVSSTAAAAGSAAAGALAGKSAAAGKGALGGAAFLPVIGPLIGLSIAWVSTRLAASTARSEPERRAVLRLARRVILFCFSMSIGLALVLGQAGKLYQASPLWIITGIIAWLALLLGGILWACARSEREVQRIRIETGTEDDAYAAKLAPHGLKLAGPVRFESKWKFFGLPCFAFAWSGFEPAAGRMRAARGWIAVGDVAVSPLFALGGFAMAPIALGGATIGILSLSLWGAALGVLAFGSVAAGWWAIGIAAVGWKAAFGPGVALAHDYAVGGWARAAEVNTPAAKLWFKEQWFADGMIFFASHAHWLIAALALSSVGWMLRRVWQLRQLRQATGAEAS